MSNASSLKEPSMEEILASIRRIIESGDERPSAAPRSRGVVEPLRPRAEPMPEGGAARAARAALLEAQTVPIVAEEPFPAPRDMEERSGASLAGNADPMDDDGADLPMPLSSLSSLSANDHSSRVRPAAAAAVPEDFRVAEAWSMPTEAAAKSDSSGRLRGSVPSQSEESVAPVPVKSVAVAPEVPGAAIINPTALAEHGGEPPVYDFNLEFDEESFSSELRDEVALAIAEAEAKPERDLAPAGDALDGANDHGGDAVAPAAALADEVAERPSLIAETSSLMSEAAGAQVASAFDELARAIREGQMKSMEEMARHMLRPMLQEWLDDNLPRIVERLVREEIERVAKGGRR